MIRLPLGLLTLGALLALGGACAPNRPAEGSEAMPPAVAGRQSTTPLPGGQPDGAVTDAATPSAAAEPDATARQSREAASPPSAVTSGDPAAKPTPSTASTSAGDLVIALTIEPGCVQPGETVNVTIDTEPSSGVSMAIGYADGKPHGAMNLGNTDAAGRYEWRVAVSPDVPPGKATVIVAGGSDDGERKGWARKSFLVAGLEGCP